MAGLGALVGVSSAGLRDFILELSEDMYMQLTYDPASIIPPQIELKITSVQMALAKLGSVEFLHYFGSTPDEVVELQLELLGNVEIRSAEGHKKGTINAQQAMLLVLARFRHAQAPQLSIARRFGSRSAGFVSGFVTATVDHLYERHRHLLELRNMRRFAIYNELWQHVIQVKYNEIHTEVVDEGDGAYVFLP